LTAAFPKHRLPRIWLRIKVAVDPAMTDAAAAFLAELCGTGVEISAGTEKARATMEKVVGYLVSDNGSEPETRASLSQLRVFLAILWKKHPECAQPELQVDTIAEEDWGKNWKKHFGVLPITPRIVIKPSWENYDGSGRHAHARQTVVIEMDPGLAFGTGHHASTGLALTLIDEIFSAQNMPDRVLDIGTGTGILAMACALLGASTGVAIDNDQDAVAAARSNVAANFLAEEIDVSGKGLSSITGCFDLITANITLDVLQELAGLIIQRLAAGGRLILAGILQKEQAAILINTYTNMGLRHCRTITRDGWAALLFLKDRT
jgi:ribosomal protein L11 methyltransferase